MKKPFIFIAFLCSLLFFLNLNSRDFWAPDEGDFAQITRELRSNFIVPHLNNEPYGEKPPFFYYVTYLSSEMLNPFSKETSMRIPSALFASIAALFLFLVLYNTRKDNALPATLMLITTPLFYWQARYLQVDMVFSSLIICAFLSFFQFYLNKNILLYYLFFVCIAFAFMTKGPLAIALVAPVLFIFLYTERNFSVFRMKETYLGGLLFLVIVVPWYLAIYVQEGFPYLYENIIRQNFSRFFDAWSHKRPVYYYFTTFPLDFFPWVIFLPGGIYLTVKTWKGDAPARFFLIWFVWIFLFLSISSGKISKYMLPALPAAAFLASATLLKSNAYRKYVYGFLACLFCSLGIVLLTYKTGLFREFIPEKIIMGSVSLIFAITLILLIMKKKMTSAFYATIVYMASLYLIGNIAIYQKVNPYKSSKPLCEKIKLLTAGGTPWVYYGSIRGVYVYYVGKYAIHIDEHDVAGLKSLPARENKFFVLTRKRDMDEIVKTLPGTGIVFEEKVGNTSMVLLHYKADE